MKYSQEEIIHALEVIQETCNEHDKCESCPFFNRSLHFTCEILRDRPEYWKINKDQIVWRAFKE